MYLRISRDPTKLYDFTIVEKKFFWDSILGKLQKNVDSW